MVLFNSALTTLMYNMCIKDWREAHDAQITTARG
jgi:hypothetical protein